MKNFLLILVCVVLGVCGQLLLKQGMSSDPDAVDRMGEVLPRLLRAAVNPVVLAGFTFYAVSAALWLIVLTRAELSWAYPMLSMGYIAVVVLSRVFFQEPVTATRFLGTLVVAFGVWLISRT
ncbi:MAG: 4-amino-4-deoxy-L-arabinose transferase [Gemmatimonadetes bacterium]|nr:4-amino-4-deoxy-L-arabinose transferase [Gemmatimonadota bacterium]